MKTRIFMGLLCLCLMLLSVLAALPMQASALPQAGGVAPWEAGEAWDGTTATAPSGTGTEEDPYRIGSAAEFKWIGNQVTGSKSCEGQYFILTADIDCNGKQLRIGSFTKSFAGVFDGNGHTVYNNKITGNSSPNGLFAYANGAIIKNLNVVASSVEKTVIYTTSGETPVYGTAGMLVGTLENSTLTGCTVAGDCTIFGGAFAGGLVGVAKNSTISYCVNNGSAGILPDTESKQSNVPNFAVGGIYGWSGGGNTVSNCINYGSVALGNIGAAKSGTNIFTVGGIVGYHTNNDTVSNCCNFGDVTGDAGTLTSRITVGGIAGRTRNSSGLTGSMTIERCCNLSDHLSGTGESKNIGSLVGYVNSGKLTVKDNLSVTVIGISEDNGAIVIDQATGANVTSENNTIATAEAIGEKVAAIHSEIKNNRVARVAIIGMQATEAVGGVCSVRILLGLDGLAYDFYKIKTTATYEKDGATQTALNGGTPLTMAFDTVYVAGSPVSAVQFGSDYLGAMVIENVPADVVIEFGIQAYIGTDAENETLVDSVICRLGEQ